jgi:hypothetical protein
MGDRLWAVSLHLRVKDETTLQVSEIGPSSTEAGIEVHLDAPSCLGLRVARYFPGCLPYTQ